MTFQVGDKVAINQLEGEVVALVQTPDYGPSVLVQYKDDNAVYVAEFGEEHLTKVLEEPEDVQFGPGDVVKHQNGNATVVLGDQAYIYIGERWHGEALTYCEDGRVPGMIRGCHARSNFTVAQGWSKVEVNA